MSKEELIEKVKMLLLKQEIEDRQNGSPKYVKKTRIYKDLIIFIETYM